MLDVDSSSTSDWYYITEKHHEKFAKGNNQGYLEFTGPVDSTILTELQKLGETYQSRENVAVAVVLVCTLHFVTHLEPPDAGMGPLDDCQDPNLLQVTPQPCWT